MPLLHSNIVGSGKPLFILHGFLGMGDNWKSLAINYVDAGYEVHLIDQRNHGRSFHSDDFSYDRMVSDLKVYADSKKIAQFDIIGHSMGGKTAMLFAVTYPEMINKLIVVDIAPKQYPQHHQDILKGLSSLDFNTIQNRNDADEQLKKYLSSMEIRQFLLKNLYRTEDNRFALRINLPALIKNIEEVGKPLPAGSVFEGDTLYMSGERSGYIDEIDKTLLIPQHFPNADFVTIKNSGHWIHAENPREFFKATIQFLSK
ncbi:MAG TPA: alpha/beta fold hydrolase [Flavobacteriaceae bacterium]|jgi:pimeloyl-ACP methyl ester carboxylesterase|nr:alpha/beta fold hydrolase [Flavobacteriaceae bacterium]